MQEQRNYIVWDLETSGLDAEEGAEIVQIGATAITYHDFSVHEAGDFQILLKPLSPEKAHPDAIKKIGEEAWAKALKEGVHPKVGLRKFVEYINSTNRSGNYYHAPIMVGFNSLRFDEPMLKYWMRKYKLQKGTEWPWCYYGKDVLMQMTDLFAKDNLPNRRLDYFAELFGLSRTGETHDALEDVHITKEIFIRYMRLMERIRKKVKIKNNEQS